MKQILFLGDSITQYAFNIEMKGFCAQLANDYTRRVDIINRGFSGYNSKQILGHIQEILRSFHSAHLGFLFLGANDAAGDSQGVQLAEFSQNMGRIVEELQKQVKRVILVTPPPVGEYEHRRNSVTKQYRDAVLLLARERGLAAIDLYSVFGADFKEKLADELHLNALGNTLVYREIQKCLGDEMEEFLPEWRLA